LTVIFSDFNGWSIFSSVYAISDIIPNFEFNPVLSANESIRMTIIISEEKCMILANMKKDLRLSDHVVCILATLIHQMNKNIKPVSDKKC
jgi:hypothetical protein